MPAAIWIVGAGILSLCVTVLVLVGSRLRALSRRVGSFDCAICTEGGGTRGGIAHYGAGRIYWWRLRSLSVRPKCVWYRDSMRIVERHLIPGTTTYVVRLRSSGQAWTLEMSADAYAGLASWLEAAPPQRRLVV